MLEYSLFASGLLRAMTRSPVSCTSFSQGHFHFFRGDFLLGCEPPREVPLKVPDPSNGACPLLAWLNSSSSSNAQPCGVPVPANEVCDGPVPAGGAADLASGKPLSCDCMGAGRPNAESGMGVSSSSSSKNGSMRSCERELLPRGGYDGFTVCWYWLAAGFAVDTSLKKSSAILNDVAGDNEHDTEI